MRKRFTQFCSSLESCSVRHNQLAIWCQRHTTMRYSARLNLGAFAAVLLHHSRLSSVSSFGHVAATQRKATVRKTFLCSSRMGMEEAPSSSPAAATPLKVLALHGSGGTAEEFPKRLEALGRALSVYTSENENLQLEVTAVQAPFVKGDGFSWWTMPPGVRSFNAEEYTGFEESATKVLNVWENGNFDVVLCHSQGAILVGALLALKRTPYHPSGGYIMNGVSFPNPYSKNLEALKDDDEYFADRESGKVSPRILFLLGKRDKIAPNATGEKLRDMLRQGGCDITSCYHQGGHGFPDEDADTETMKTITEWIRDGRS